MSPVVLLLILFWTYIHDTFYTYSECILHMYGIQMCMSMCMSCRLSPSCEYSCVQIYMMHFTHMYKALYMCMAYTCVCHAACLSLSNILVYTYTWCILHIFIMCILHMYGIDMCTLCRLSLFCYYSTLSLSHSFSLSSFLLWKNKEAIDPPFYV